MLYLAEVKKQNRGFIGGSRTELKLLAFQHNDQTWSALQDDEMIFSEDIEQVGEGTLMMVNLSNTRQIQGKPELAAPELVRQLQKLSRLSEKLKAQQEEIEQWKQSLTFQSQELARRETEMEAKIEQLEQVETELGEIELRRQEAQSVWQRVEQTQQSLQEFQSRFSDLLELPSQQVEKLQQLIRYLLDHDQGLPSIGQRLQLALNTTVQQEEIITGFWQQIEPLKAQISQQQKSVEQQRQHLENQSQEMESTRSSLEQAKTQLQVQQNILNNKLEQSTRLNLELQRTQDLQDTLESIASGTGNVQLDSKVDVVALENMPLGELEETVNNLQEALDKLVRLVNDQEEELTLQCQTVEELQVKLATASTSERLSLEQELADEQERKEFLDETLVGQRRRIKELQEVLLQNLKVLRRRQGVMDFEPNAPSINLEPILLHIEELQNNTVQERQKLESEIEHLEQSLRQIQEMIKHLDTEQSQKMQAFKAEQDNLYQAQIDITKLETRLSLYEEILQPIQNQLDQLKQQLNILQQWLNFT
ncbi:MAG TPA: hypothetical protein DCF68_21480 [Cyanothece sp. UBA12306]|nr:hypothetical protein [Cyanothece sp. UBA12306]